MLFIIPKGSLITSFYHLRVVLVSLLHFLFTQLISSQHQGSSIWEISYFLVKAYFLLMISNLERNLNFNNYQETSFAAVILSIQQLLPVSYHTFILNLGLPRACYLQISLGLDYHEYYLHSFGYQVFNQVHLVTVVPEGG